MGHAISRPVGRVLVVGGSSLLGQYVVREALAREHRVWTTSHSTPSDMRGVRDMQADLADASSLQRAFSDAKPDNVILCAALTGVDYCEENPGEAELVNAVGPAAVAELCDASGARLVHISTDYVFDGEEGPYSEEAMPSPPNVYGMTKRDGELAVLERLRGAIIVRVCALYGWNRLRKKMNSVTWIVDRLRRGEAVPLFTDQRVSPTYAFDASSMILDLAASDVNGIFHIAPPQCVTRFELGEAVCDVFDLPGNLLRPSTTEEANLRAKRPRHSCLTSKRLDEALDRSVRPLHEALVHMRDAE